MTDTYDAVYGHPDLKGLPRHVRASLSPNACERNMDLYVSGGNLFADLTGMTMLVEGLIAAGRLYEFFGRWKSGKTVLAVELALRLALGQNFGDRRTVQSLVVYIAGESVEDIQGRIKAFCIQNEQDTAPETFYLRRKPVALTDPESSRQLLHELMALMDRHPNLPLVIVIDTLARNFGPGSENNDDDMGRFTSNLIDSVLNPLNATGIVVHHTGHSATERSRGHSSWPAAIDGQFAVTKDDRDGAPSVCRFEPTDVQRRTVGDGMAFELHGVEMTHPDGSPICVNFGNPWHEPVARFMGEGYTPQPKHKRGTLGKNQQVYLDVLRRLYGEDKERRPDLQCWVTDEMWRDGLRSTDEYDAKHFTRTVKALVNSGHVRDVSHAKGSMKCFVPA